MEVVFKGLIGTIAMIYIDDIVVYSKTERQHTDHLKIVFDRLRQYNLTLNPSKCVFGLRQVKFLGYIVSSQGLSADPEKAAAISRMTSPQATTEVRTFLGMTGYYRSCIPDYAKIAEPLVELTRKNFRFTWEDRHQSAFDQLKAALISDTIMAHPQTDKPYHLYTDACDYAIGAILCQKDSKGVERPIVYLSKQLSDTQRRWATIEKEAYAVVYALKQLRPYLWGAEYYTYTDHKPLTSLFTKDLNNTKIQRWAVLLAEYNCKVQYHKGKLNVRADMLSRIKQREQLNTFDIAQWQLGDKLPPLPADDKTPQLYSVNMATLPLQQRAMTEWSEHLDEDSNYELVNGLLYSIKKPYSEAAQYPRLVLPPEQRQGVIDKAHAEVGHMSAMRTMRKIQEAFVWPKMKAEIRRALERCPTCIVHSKRHIHTRMGEMPIATSPMQLIAADLVGPLVKTPYNNQYILTIIDHCTGWAEAFPIPNKTSHCVWRQLALAYFSRHGYPDILLTDQGLEFNAKEFTSYLEAVGVQHRRTSPYNPQTNGRCERFNSTLKSILSRLINNDRDSWEDQLGPALLAYNSSVSDVTGYTPYFLHHGRRPRLPLTKLLPLHHHADSRLQDLTDALRTAAIATEDARRYNRLRINSKARAQTLSPGDTVVIKAPDPLTLTSKWDPQWTVTQVKDKVVWLTHQQTGKQKILNVNKVRLVDPEIAWDELNPRPVRNTRRPARLQLGPRPTILVGPPQLPANASDVTRTAPRGGRNPKRMRTDDALSDTPQQQGHTKPLDSTSDSTFPRKQQDNAHRTARSTATKRTASPTPLHSAKTFRPTEHRRPVGYTSKSTPAKRLHSQAQTGNPRDSTERLKRARLSLPRGCKRQWRPPNAEQKRQRLHAIQLVQCFTS